MAAETPKWVLTQKKTFTKWANMHLRRAGKNLLEDLEGGFEDGIAIMDLVNALYDIPIPKHQKNPRMRPQKLDNLSQAFKMIEAAQIKTHFLHPHHLLDHDQKMILGMLWAFILDYAIKGISVDEKTAKEGLLLWCRKKTKGYRDVDPPGVENFHISFKNGMALCALIHRHRPELIPYDTLNKANAAENLELAFAVAEEHLNIPRLLDVEDLTDIPRPDERSVMTYISEFFHAFASQNIKENSARRVGNFLEFTMGLLKQQAEYEASVKELLDWTAAKKLDFEEKKFGDTFEDAVTAFDQFKEYTMVEKPQRAGQKLDVEAKYAEIQTELLVNDRKPYEPPADATTDAIDGAFASLLVAEAEYAKAVRDNRFRFIEKRQTQLPQEKIDEISEAFDHFDTNHSDTLDKIEFKAALQAMSVPFKDEEAFNKVFNKVSEGQEFISRQQWLVYNTALLEDRDTPDQIVTSFEVMADQQDMISPDQLNIRPLTEEQIAYLLSKLPKREDAELYDFKSFVASQFLETAEE